MASPRLSSPRSFCLMPSQLLSTSPEVWSFSSPNTCGCRLISFWQMARSISPQVSVACSSPTTAWKASCRNTSPSSSAALSQSSSSSAQEASFASSTRYLARLRWVCSRSQGQPSGARRRRIRPSRSSGSNSVFSRRPRGKTTKPAVWSYPGWRSSSLRGIRIPLRRALSEGGKKSSSAVSPYFSSSFSLTSPARRLLSSSTTHRGCWALWTARPTAQAVRKGPRKPAWTASAVSSATPGSTLTLSPACVSSRRTVSSRLGSGTA